MSMPTPETINACRMSEGEIPPLEPKRIGFVGKVVIVFLLLGVVVAAVMYFNRGPQPGQPAISSSAVVASSRPAGVPRGVEVLWIAGPVAMISGDRGVYRVKVGDSTPDGVVDDIAGLYGTVAISKDGKQFVYRVGKIGASVGGVGSAAGRRSPELSSGRKTASVLSGQSR